MIEKQFVTKNPIMNAVSLGRRFDAKARCAVSYTVSSGKRFDAKARCAVSYTVSSSKRFEAKRETLYRELGVFVAFILSRSLERFPFLAFKKAVEYIAVFIFRRYE